MKLYVLDESRPTDEVSVETPGRARSRRVMLVVGVLVPLALVLCYFHLGAGAGGDAEGSSAASVSIDGSLAPAMPAGTGGVSVAEQKPIAMAVSRAEPEPPGPASLASSSVTRRDGKYFVELNGVEASAALAMMSEATSMKVLGGDALLDHPLRITAKVVTASPVVAWQSVFGDVASFAISCPGKTCVVHIVSAASAASNPPVASVPVAPPLVAPAQYGSAAVEAPTPGATVYRQDD
jgi:hypothetical protein